MFLRRPDVRSFISLQFSPVWEYLALPAWEVIYFSTEGHWVLPCNPTEMLSITSSRGWSTDVSCFEAYKAERWKWAHQISCGPDLTLVMPLVPRVFWVPHCTPLTVPTCLPVSSNLSHARLRKPARQTSRGTGWDRDCQIFTCFFCGRFCNRQKFDGMWLRWKYFVSVLFCRRTQRYYNVVTEKIFARGGDICERVYTKLYDKALGNARQ